MGRWVEKGGGKGGEEGGVGWGDGWRRVGEGGERVGRRVGGWMAEGGEEEKGRDNKNISIHLHYFYIKVIFSNKLNKLS